MRIDKSIVLTSKNLKLRIPSVDDFDHIFSATRFEGFNDGMLWDPPNSKEELIKPLHNGIKAWEQGKAFSFTIEKKTRSEFLGRISIRMTDIKDRWNIGFWTHPIHQKKGVMTEAVGVILKFGFEQLHANSIEACHAVWNTGSEKVLKSNGMTFINYIEKGFKKNGQWVDENLLAIDKEEWTKSSS